MSTNGGAAPLLSISELHVSYGGIQALLDVSLEVHAGEVVTLIGANGAGKSTTLRSISRLVPVRRGRIVYDGPSETLRKDPAKLEQLIGVVKA